MGGGGEGEWRGKEVKKRGCRKGEKKGVSGVQVTADDCELADHKEKEVKVEVEAEVEVEVEEDRSEI